MDAASVEERVPLDIRQPYEKRLAEFVILASIVLEFTAFDSLQFNLADSLKSNKVLSLH